MRLDASRKYFSGQTCRVDAAAGDEAAYAYVTIYAQWGNVPKALDWLEKALQMRAADLEQLKMEPLFDSLRNEARFQAVERELKFPM